MPRRFTSEMSRTMSTSASLRPFAPRSLASRTSSPRRNLYMSGHGVGLTIFERIPIWPSSRASAVSEPHTSPSALMWVDIATERPARRSCGRRSIAARRCWGTLRTSSMAFGAGQLRVRSAIEEIDQQTQDHPIDQPLPRCRRQARHHVATDEDSKDGNERNEGRAKRSGEIRRLVAQRDDSGTHNDEREQRSDRYQLAQQSNWEESGHDSGDTAGEDRRHVWRLEAGVNFAEHGREQSIAGHRIEDPGLAHEHH